MTSHAASDGFWPLSADQSRKLDWIEWVLSAVQLLKIHSIKLLSRLVDFLFPGLELASRKITNEDEVCSFTQTSLRSGTEDKGTTCGAGLSTFPNSSSSTSVGSVTTNHGRRGPNVLPPPRSVVNRASSSGYLPSRSVSTFSATVANPAAVNRKPQGNPNAVSNHRRCASSMAGPVAPLGPARLNLAIRKAILRRELHSLETLLLAADASLWQDRDTAGYTVLQNATAQGCLQVVHLLLKAIPNKQQAINTPGPQGQTCLHLACRKQSFEISQLLLQNGADVNACTNLLTTPLHLATGAGDIQLAALLLSEGAEPNCVSKLGTLPLVSAVHLQDINLVNLLLSYGANPRLTTKDNVSAQALALKLNLTSILTSMDEHIRKRGHKRVL